MDNLQTQPNMDQHDTEQHNDEQSHSPIAAPARRLRGARAGRARLAAGDDARLRVQPQLPWL